MNGPQAAWLPDGRRLHLNHGPIDLIVEAFGAPDELRLAYVQAATRFKTVLPELVEELDAIRKPANQLPRRFRGADLNCVPILLLYARDRSIRCQRRRRFLDDELNCS